ncbi:erythromycin esterase family protein [Hymenobacter sp. 102]|uniref:erythromycin esterase family protein n=1 Tax=Hymenobacter sp. 102 TaxID=3403152 RepID=UPI003CF74726
MFSIRVLALAGLLSVLAGPMLAQNAPTAAAASVPIPTHPVRSISPTDTDFADLEFLRQEIGGARVIMLGEPTHGEGNVFEAKIRLMRFLQERMGFTTVAFESGIYELDRAQRELQKGASAAEAIDNSVFGVWTSTREFRGLLPLLGPGKLKVAGFDYQLSGAYQEELLEELEAFLKPEKGADGIAYDYLDECISMMGEHFLFPPSHQLVLFNMQMNKARKLLEKVAAGPNAQRRERAVFWLQNLRSLQALAHDYATNDPGVKDSTEWTPTTSNPRDAQMADNLLWYARQHPQEKIICWGALPHLANQVQALNTAETNGFRPMGQAVKEGLGAEAVYVLGTLAGGGTHGFGSWGKYLPVPAPAAGTLEAELLAQGQEYSFVSLKHDAPGRSLTTYAFDYRPITGPWSKVVDGFLFLKAVNPPHGAQPVATSPTSGSSAPANTSRPPSPVNFPDPIRRTAAAKTGGAAFTLSGAVLDRKTGQPVPFATVAIPARSAGTVTDAQGRFRLEARRGEVVQISSIGYEPGTLTAAAGTAATVRLVPAAFALADVRVSAQSQDPKRIMKKVIKAIETNYEQQDYMAQVYTHRRISNFDTLQTEVEYISQLFEPAGYQHRDGGFLFMGPFQKHRVQEKHIVVQPQDSTRRTGLPIGSSAETSDPVRTSPLFKSATLSKFALRLDTIRPYDGATVYVLNFAVKRATHRSTGNYLEAGYSGKVYVRQDNYAVVRYEALWQFDTTRYNAVSHKYYGRNNQISRLYTEVFSDNRTANIVLYQKGAAGRYHPAESSSQSLAIGRKLGGKPFYSQGTTREYFTSLPAGTALVPLNPKIDPRTAEFLSVQLKHTPYRPEFWQTYQRPVPAEPAPTLEATK